MKRLGASVDWSREYFTMDDRLSVAVEKPSSASTNKASSTAAPTSSTGTRAARPPSPTSKSTHEERLGKLYHIRYPLADGTGSIVVATTRPETMLGDAAVAVNPTDERYTALIGKKVRCL